MRSTCVVSWLLLSCALVASGPALARKAPAPLTHRVAAGDTLGGIAQKYGCSVEALRVANRLKHDRIVVGRDLRLPGGEAASEEPSEEKATQKATATVASHIVLPGETLAEIALRYLVTPDVITRANRLKKPFLRVGQELRVPTTVPFRARHRLIYEIRPGDTLTGIAERFGVPWKVIQALNPKKNPESLRIGDRIVLVVEGPIRRSHAVGRPQDGQLVNGEQIPPGPGYFRRRPDRAWGTNETVTGILSAIAEVRRKHPRVHDLAIGDLSKKGGGDLAPHKSHQSGRDADLGYYFLRQPKEGPKGFLKAYRGSLDFEASWSFIKILTGSSRAEAKVDYIFMNHAVQKLFYEWARAKGTAPKLLEYVFQYPHGKRAMRGILRHEPGHDGHMHVRFKCPPQDDHCV
jgi:LysM repeat protein